MGLVVACVCLLIFGGFGEIMVIVQESCPQQLLKMASLGITLTSVAHLAVSSPNHQHTTTRSSVQNTSVRHRPF